MRVEIKHTKTGNCACMNCGKVQDKIAMQPLTVWVRYDNERRGHNNPVCSIECATAFIEKLNN